MLGKKIFSLLIVNALVQLNLSHFVSQALLNNQFVTLESLMIFFIIFNHINHTEVLCMKYLRFQEYNHFELNLLYKLFYH